MFLNIQLRWCVLLAVLLLASCSKEVKPKEPVADKEQANLVKERISDIFLQDNLPVESLKTAIGQSIKYFKRLPKDAQFSYGEHKYTAPEMIRSLQLFETILVDYNRNPNQFLNQLAENFHIFRSPGGLTNQKVRFTGYFEPIYPGSLKPGPDYPVPAYALPQDLKTLNLGRFSDALKQQRIIYRKASGDIVPYYSRKEIMKDNAIKNKAKVVAWFKNPVDLFFMQVQGSGVLRLPDGEQVSLGYGGGNGRSYTSIGKLLIEEGILNDDNVSLKTIRKYLFQASLPEVERVLYANESYIFFQVQSSLTGPVGSINVPLTPERSIATDYLSFPKGSLAFIDTQIPDCSEQGICQVQPLQVRRFVLNQDTGGAIRGYGRADLFWGRGARAESSAGQMNVEGDMFFIVAKKEKL